MRELRSAPVIAHNMAMSRAMRKISDMQKKGQKAMGDAVRQMFTAIAQHYDVPQYCAELWLAPLTGAQQAVAVSGIPSGARLLDVCSGTADLALAFARHLGHDGQVVATDFCAAMLGRGHQKARQQGIRLTSTLADAQQPPTLVTPSFDAVTVALWPAQC